MGRRRDWLSGWPLEIQVLIVAIFISSSILVTTNWVGELTAVRAVERTIATQTGNAARALAEQLHGPFRAEYAPQFERKFRELQELEPNVTRVDLYADFGGELRLVGSSSTRGDRELEGQEIAAHQQGKAATFIVDDDVPRRIISVYPVDLEGGSKGFVSVTSSLQAVDDIVAAHSRIRLFSVLTTIVLLVGAIVLLFRTTVYSSVLHLVEVMTRFKKGDNSARANENLPGQFADIACQFNHMLEEIQKSKENLQLRIEEATAELAAQNRELQDLNLRLFEAQRQLVEAERLAVIGQLAATLAHEIGSPLSAVSTHLQILLEEKPLDSRAMNRLRLINEEIDRVSEIVENLLTTIRQKYRRSPVDLEEVVSKVAQLLGPTMEARGVTFELKADGRPLLVEGDPGQLQELFLNLFKNSLDAIRGFGVISVQISRCLPSGDLPQAHFQVEVRDSGEGIPPAKIDRIFEPFFTTKELGKGSGLGLAVCKEIVTRHGGSISVASCPGRGTTFKILLPEMESQRQSWQAELPVQGVEAR